MHKSEKRTVSFSRGVTEFMVLAIVLLLIILFSEQTVTRQKQWEYLQLTRLGTDQREPCYSKERDRWIIISGNVRVGEKCISIFSNSVFLLGICSTFARNKPRRFLESGTHFQSRPTPPPALWAAPKSGVLDRLAPTQRNQQLGCEWNNEGQTDGVGGVEESSQGRNSNCSFCFLSQPPLLQSFKFTHQRLCLGDPKGLSWHECRP